MTKEVVNIIGYQCGSGAEIKSTASGPSSYFSSKSFSDLKLKTPNLEFIDHKTKSKSNTNIQQNIIQEHCSNLAFEVMRSINNKQKFITIGGDHSSAIGTFTGVAHALDSHGDVGLIFVDAHLDSHTPDSSPTGNIHGQPMAHLFGYGYPKLSQLLDKSKPPVLNPEHVCFIGARSYEKEEQDFLNQLGVKIFYNQDVKENGLVNIWNEAQSIVSKAKYFGVSIDLDVFDPEYVTGTGTKVEDGLNPIELLPLMNGLSNYDKFVGLEIAEYNAILDSFGLTAELISDIIGSVFRS